VPPPENYNSAALSIRVDPLTLWRYATVDLKDQGTVVAEAIGRIHNIWQGLELGWAGQTAVEAQDFGNRWVASITGLFGTEGDEDSGALVRLQKAVAQAAINYAVTEDTVWRMFTEFNYAYDTPSKGGVSPPYRNNNDGPVHENTPQ
jgi:hypothetical protein